MEKNLLSDESIEEYLQHLPTGCHDRFRLICNDLEITISSNNWDSINNTNEYPKAELPKNTGMKNTISHT